MADRLEEMFKIMRKESERLKTFQMNPPWPKDYIDIKKLAKAGFFYAFTGDTVCCAFCHGQVNRWERDDDPMYEHVKHFTTCPFIMGGEVGNEPLGEDPFPGPKRPRPYDVCGIHPPQPPQPQPTEHYTNGNRRHLHRIGDPIHTRHHFIGTHEDADDDNEPDDDDEDDEYDEDNLNNRNLSQQQDALLPSNQYDNQLNNSSNFLHQFHHTPAYDDSLLSNQSHGEQRLSPSSSLTSNSGNSSSSLNGICKICYTNSIELVFLPCGHSVSCLSCAQRLHSCPCCRATITTRIRTFLV